MAKIAIDIVLIPPKNISDLAIELNKKTDQSKIKLGQNLGEAIPHISLAMGAIYINDLSKLELDIKSIIENHHALNLKLNGTRGGEIEDEGYIYGIEIEKTDELVSLHTEVMDILKKYYSSDFDEGSFADKGQGIKRAFKWVSNYTEHSAYGKFRPHITIGFGEAQKIEGLEFVASTLAICQLGSYCTCKKVLREFSLK